MSKYRPLKYREVVKILNNLGFKAEPGRGTSHQTWTLNRNGKNLAVTIFFHGSNLEFRPGTLNSIIRQSGFSKDEFYKALKK
ncbi:MAG TPA: type II toxin-antitoxin system HicA family toxin [Xanthomonadales bacterium]|nr:type II toxin-antitoxin system HicA family toxin [Xanthomonadales bacterium]